MEPNKTDKSMEPLVEDGSLETSEPGKADAAATDQPTTNTATPNPVKPPKNGGLLGRVRQLIAKTNIYVLLFLGILLVAGVILFLTISRGGDSSKITSGDIQELTPEALANLSGDEIRVGDPKSVLNVESNAIFAASVLVKGGLDVAGTIKVGGALSLPGITVSGTAQFDQVQLNALTVTGGGTIQGVLNIQQGLVVSGTGSFSGAISAPTINIDTLKLGSDLQLNGHIDAGGKTPGVSTGAGTGSGGTVSISGTDTAGTVTINVGSGAPAGVLANITFGKSFAATPHVVITPVGLGASGLNYYLSARSTSGFSIATGNAASSGSFSFDYIVID